MNELFFSVIAGSIVGFTSTFISAWLIERGKSKAYKSSYRFGLKLELKSAVKSLDDIKIAYERDSNRFFDYVLLDLLDVNVANLLDTRRNIYILQDEETQEETYSIINKLTILAKGMRGTQDFEYTSTGEATSVADVERKASYVKDKKVSHITELLDIKRDISETLKKL